jgi:PKHD-type hydroxylase
MSQYFPIQRPELPNWSPVAIYRDAFSVKECEDIKSSYDATTKAVTANDRGDVRKSTIEWIQPNESTQWLYQKLAFFIYDVNTYRYRMDIDGFCDPIQFTKYSTDGEYNWHIDIGQNSSMRKLTAILNLDDPQSYEGGGTDIMYSKDVEKCPKEQGTLIVFPSYILHRGGLVTSGTRHILVAWAGGSHYR